VQRRSLFKLGIGAAAVLAVGGGAVALFQPGLAAGRLTARSRQVFRNIGAAMLEGSLPAGLPAHSAALNGLLERIDILISALPGHSQDELSQMLALLGTPAGRRTLGGLDDDWASAGAAQVQAALQAMRTSRLALRQQAYHALHDIVGGAYFADAAAWQMLGYPGPLKI